MSGKPLEVSDAASPEAMASGIVSIILCACGEFNFLDRTFPASPMTPRRPFRSAKH